MKSSGRLSLVLAGRQRPFPARDNLNRGFQHSKRQAGLLSEFADNDELWQDPDEDQEITE